MDFLFTYRDIIHTYSSIEHLTYTHSHTEVVRLGGFQPRSSEGNAGRGEVMARGGARRRETGRGASGERKTGCRAHEPRSGGSHNRGGDQSGPSRRGDLSRPDPPSEIFQRGNDPRKISLRPWPTPTIFSEGEDDPQIFFQTIM